MKRALFLLPVVLLYLAFACCKKASGPADGKSVQQNNKIDSMVSIAALINGENWQTDSAYCYKVGYSGNDTGKVNLLITASKRVSGNTSTIEFKLTNYYGPGSYAINPPLNTATYYIGNQRHFATSGEMIINTDTAYALIGIFYFTADSINVEQGIFNVTRP